jgi:hypothetical protein
MNLAVSGVLSTGFGLLMATVPAIGSHGPALVAAAVAVAAVLAGTVLRSAATLAVLTTVLVIVLLSPPPVFAALSGVCAVVYLVLRHTATVTAPTVVAALAFMVAGLAATSFPLRLPWLPLVAPLAVFGIYAVATRPFLGAGR